MSHYRKATYRVKDVKSAMVRKGFRRVKGKSKHQKYILTRENGQDTRYRLSMYNQHGGKSSELNYKKMSNLSSELGLVDTKFFCEYIECTHKGPELLAKLESD